MPALVCLFTSPAVDGHPPPKATPSPRTWAQCALPSSLLPTHHLQNIPELRFLCEYHSNALSSSQGSWSLPAGDPWSCLHQALPLPAGAEIWIFSPSVMFCNLFVPWGTCSLPGAINKYECLQWTLMKDFSCEVSEPSREMLQGDAGTEPSSQRKISAILVIM